MKHHRTNSSTTTVEQQLNNSSTNLQQYPQMFQKSFILSIGCNSLFNISSRFKSNAMK